MWQLRLQMGGSIEEACTYFDGSLLWFAIVISCGCNKTEAKQPAPQPLPVKTETINLSPVPQGGRVCGDGEVAPLGQHPAPGGWLIDADPGEVGRPRARRPSADDDRSAEAAGDG